MSDKVIQLKKRDGTKLYPRTKVSSLINDDGSNYIEPRPVEKRSEQTQEVGIDSTGKLFTLPAGTGPKGDTGPQGPAGKTPILSVDLATGYLMVE